jgi:O-antigen/teichoic acid export membrane protein
MKLLPSSGFARNVLTLMAGTTIAQAVTVAISPILTRLYGPADFGAFASLSALANIAALVATGRYEIAIPLPQTEREGSQLLGLAISSSAVLASIVLMIVLVFGDALTGLVGGEVARVWLFLVPLSMVLTGSIQAFQYWMTRRQAFRPIASSSIVQSLSTAATNLALAPLHKGPLGLFMGLLVGQVASLGNLLAALVADRSRRPERPSVSEMRAVARSHAKFPLFDLPNALSYALSQRGILVLITGFFSTGVVGMYSLTERVVLSPFTILTNSYGQVLYQKLAETFRENPSAFGAEIVHAMNRLALMLAVPFAVLAVSCKWLVPIVFGSKWSDLYLYVLIMAPNAFLTLIAAPAGNVLRILDRQHVSLLLNARLFVTRFAALGLAAKLLSFDIYRSLLVLSSITFAIVLINIRTVLHHAGQGFPRLLLLVGMIAVLWYVGVLYFLV